MVSPDYFERPSREEDQLIAHEIDFVDDESGDLIRFFKSDSALPVPRLNESLLFTTVTMGERDEKARWVNDESLPDSEGLLYQVVHVSHEYASIELEDSVRDDHREGLAIRAHVRLKKEETEKLQ